MGLSGTGTGVGGLLGIFCPACVPAIGSIFAAIGLGALVNFKLLGILTATFLILGLLGLFLNYRAHKQVYFLLIGLVASLGVFGGRYLMESPYLLYSGGAVLLGNALFDYRALKKCKSCKC